MARLLETELYAPIKAFLERQGFAVKAEIGAADVVAMRGGEAPMIVELKTGFNLTVLHQAIARQAITDRVYVAVPRPAGEVGLRRLRDNLGLCRRLGLGLLTVRLSDGLVEVRCEPAPFRPRKVAARRDRLLREFARRTGDPNVGGATRSGLVTAYRQDAVRCARHLAAAGPCRGAVVARVTGVERATRMMADDHYGWFRRIETGIYALTEKGHAAMAEQDDG